MSILESPLKASNLNLAIVGLGYVGLPLAAAFAAVRETIGFDTNDERIRELLVGKDGTGQLANGFSDGHLQLRLTSDPDDLKSANCYIVTVPTPVDSNNQPDLSYLKSASETVGRYLQAGDIVIYESTVFPGCTEEECVPVLERMSGLHYAGTGPQFPDIGRFHVGYSPERINPGDKSREIHQIVKITSGSSPAVADVVDELYREIITAGTYKAESIAVAEAAKVVENTQRDINIALVNEVAVICNHLGIDTESVLRAAETKWNFQSFRPGLVGGHCIGVDPYYLTHKAQKAGYEPRVILAGRQINDYMGRYVARELSAAMMDAGIKLDESNVLILGLTFKENCHDVRNSKVFDVLAELRTSGCSLDVCDPWVNETPVGFPRSVRLVDDPETEHYDAIVLAVSHNEFKAWGAEKIRSFGKTPSIIYDLKHMLPKGEADIRL